MQTRDMIDETLVSIVESSVDSLVDRAMQTGVNFDADSRETHEKLFGVAAQRAELMKLVSRIVQANHTGNVSREQK